MAQVLLNEVKNDLNMLKVDMAELEELREFRADVARKEKAHADLIASQAKRLDELEALYKEEQVRAGHNTYLSTCMTFDTMNFPGLFLECLNPMVGLRRSSPVCRNFS